MPTLATVTVPVIKAFRHHGREMSVGESVTVSALDASILARQQCVSLTRTSHTKVVTPEHESEPDAPRPRRRYRRRDLQAEG
jgi:hypothetical protein